MSIRGIYRQWCRDRVLRADVRRWRRFVTGHDEQAERMWFIVTLAGLGLFVLIPAAVTAVIRNFTDTIPLFVAVWLAISAMNLLWLLPMAVRYGYLLARYIIDHIAENGLDAPKEPFDFLSFKRARYLRHHPLEFDHSLMDENYNEDDEIEVLG